MSKHKYYGGGSRGSQTYSYYSSSHCNHLGHPVQVGPYTIYAGGSRYLKADKENKALKSMDLVIPLDDEVILGDPGQRITYLFWPWRDQDSPQPKFLVFLENVIIPELKAGKKILVYCTGGHGRTGTFLATLIALLEPEVEDPVATLRSRYCEEAVESQAQYDYIFEELKGVKVPEEYRPKYATYHGSYYSGQNHPVGTASSWSAPTAKKEECSPDDAVKFIEKYLGKAIDIMDEMYPKKTVSASDFSELKQSLARAYSWIVVLDKEHITPSVSAFMGGFKNIASVVKEMDSLKSKAEARAEFDDLADTVYRAILVLKDDYLPELKNELKSIPEKEDSPAPTNNAQLLSVLDKTIEKAEQCVMQPYPSDLEQLAVMIESCIDLAPQSGRIARDLDTLHTHLKALPRHMELKLVVNALTGAQKKLQSIRNKVAGIVAGETSATDPKSPKGAEPPVAEESTLSVGVSDEKTVAISEEGGK